MKKMQCAIIALMLLIILCACGKVIKPKDERWPVTLGGYTFTHVPKRVVTLSPAMTDTIYALGYGGRVVGISDYCKLPTKARDAVLCGTALLPNLDAILQLKTDTLFTSAALPTGTTKALEEAGIQIIVISYADTIEGVLNNYHLICTAFEGEKTGSFKAEQMTFFAQTMLDYIKATAAMAIDPEQSGAVYLRKLPSYLATGDTLEGRLLNDIGFENKGADATSWYYPTERLAALLPDYIFCDESISLDVLKASDYYKQSPAVINAQVFAFDARVFERQAPAMFFAVEDLMRTAFPEAFEADRPSLIMPMPDPEPEPEKAWWLKLLGK